MNVWIIGQFLQFVAEFAAGKTHLNARLITHWLFFFLAVIISIVINFVAIFAKHNFAICLAVPRC